MREVTTQYQDITIFCYHKDSDGNYTDRGKDIWIEVDESTIATLCDTADEVVVPGDPRHDWETSELLGFRFDDIAMVDKYIAMYPNATVSVDCGRG
jgi:hypothetical protein